MQRMRAGFLQSDGQDERDDDEVRGERVSEKRYVSLQPLYRWTTQSNRGKR